MQDATPDLESTLADVTRISLAELKSLDDPILSRSLLRLIEDAEAPSEAIAGFQSSVLPYEPKSGLV
jgi:FXSXX-COOH protein